nr:MAG TPA: hypothetical protein [Caudoviricetes sp.]
MKRFKRQLKRFYRQISRWDYIGICFAIPILKKIRLLCVCIQPFQWGAHRPTP